MMGWKMLPARTSNEQCRQHGGGPVHDVVIWKRDGAGGCQNLLARNVWKMLPARISAKYMNFGPFREVDQARGECGQCCPPDLVWS